ncbi:unnamed protein product [Protopolystoma xenopodis]|uniref:Uncharacterized protein n=1 Tax=Protopolystoma xenopodis TaxID=117903 RepID=A0A3S5CPM0_9PLAT|nr:unnamed protein product [Protopolystoma xenopodis]
MALFGFSCCLGARFFGDVGRRVNVDVDPHIARELIVILNVYRCFVDPFHGCLCLHSATILRLQLTALLQLFGSCLATKRTGGSFRAVKGEEEPWHIVPKQHLLNGPPFLS